MDGMINGFRNLIIVSPIHWCCQKIVHVWPWINGRKRSFAQDFLLSQDQSSVNQILWCQTDWPPHPRFSKHISNQWTDNRPRQTKSASNWSFCFCTGIYGVTLWCNRISGQGGHIKSTPESGQLVLINLDQTHFKVYKRITPWRPSRGHKISSLVRKLANPMKSDRLAHLKDWNNEKRLAFESWQWDFSFVFICHRRRRPTPFLRLKTQSPN